MKKEKSERKKMGKKTKITMIVLCSVLGLFLLTFIVTFLGGELPWTAHRSSAIQIPQVKWYEYEGYEEAGQKAYFENLDKEERQERFQEICFDLEDLGEKFGIRMNIAGIEDDKWVLVGVDDENENELFLARGLLNLYAKCKDIPIFWKVMDWDAFEAQ